MSNVLRPEAWPGAHVKAESPAALTARQLECLAWAAAGKSASDIGVILGLSTRTVEDHFARAARNLGVRTRVQAILRAQALGLLQLIER